MYVFCSVKKFVLHFPVWQTYLHGIIIFSQVRDLFIMYIIFGICLFKIFNFYIYLILFGIALDNV